MALPTDQQPSQVGTYEKILTIANRIMNGGEITKEEAIELIHTSDDDTMILLLWLIKFASISMTIQWMYVPL